MHRNLHLTLVVLLATCLSASAQWTITSLGVTNDTITFDSTFSGVNNGAFAGDGYASSPANGQLDSDAWKVTGLSDGDSYWGGTFSSGDHARGGSGGGVSSGGAYSFEVASGDSALGFQGTSSDWTPGSVMLMVINNTGFSVDSFHIDYDLMVNNDQGRANSFDFSYGINDSSSFTSVSSLDYSSTATSQGSVSWVEENMSAGVIDSIGPGDTLFLVWTSDDDGGSGSRDEFALNNIGVTFDTGSVAVTTPAPSIPYYNIATINTVDAVGEPDSIGVECWTSGVVVGIDMDGNTGLSFTIMDTIGGINGINIYNFNDVSGYVVQEGDSILVRGEVDFFNGLTELFPDSIELINQNNPIPDTLTVTSLGESTESELIKFEDAQITAISGTNYTLVSGTDTVVMRVDTDTDVLDSLTLSIGDSLCWVVGIGGQYDPSSPYFDGYQIFPRWYLDVDTSCGGITIPTSAVPIYPISTIETVDANGEVDSANVVCGVQGIVVGVDLQGTSSNNAFTVIDNTGGIAVFAFGGFTPAYTVTEGDEVIVYGSVDQFNGLAQIAGDSMVVLSSNNSLPTPAIVTDLDESTESEYIEMHDFEIIGISGSNYDLTNGSDTIIMRVDSDTDVDDSLTFAIGDTICSLIGIGGQFDNSSPYFDGYQIFPHHYYDVDLCGAGDPPPASAAPFYPIPDINDDDANGEPDSIGVYCWTSGIVLGLDLRGGAGLSFTLWDGQGINVFNFNDVSGYAVTEGDSLMLRGTIDFYNGLTEIVPDSIEVLNTGNTLPAEMNVAAPSAMTESAPMVIEGVEYAAGTGTWPDPASFTGSRNITLVNCDNDTIVMRIDSDTDIDENWFADSTKTMTIHGIGGQFDGSAPYTEGYQIFPMYLSDIDTSATPSTPPSFVINELMADNASTYADENGDFDDWVELYNATSQDIPLAGLYVTNDSQDPMKYQIPVTSTETIPAGGYAIIWCDAESSEGDLHTTFELDAAGGFVGVVHESGCDLSAVDSIVYPAIAVGHSYGRSTDGAATWIDFGVPTPNAMNEILGVAQVSSTDLTAYPNPNSTGMLLFNKSVSFNMYNTIGQHILSRSNVSQLNLTQIESGLYILETTQGEVFRLIVQ